MSSFGARLIAMVLMVGASSNCSYWADWGRPHLITTGNCVEIDVQVQGEYPLPVHRVVVDQANGPQMWEARPKGDGPFHIRSILLCTGPHTEDVLIPGVKGDVEYSMLGPDGRLVLEPGMTYRVRVDVASRWRDVVVEVRLPDPTRSRTTDVVSKWSRALSPFPSLCPP